MGTEAVTPNPWMILPFGVLLGAIALVPLAFAHWWHRHYPKVALSLAGATLTYYLFVLHAVPQVLHVAHEYLSFICLMSTYLS